MALKPFLVKRPATRAVDNVTALAVFAADAAQAKAIAGDYTGKDTPVAWQNATATEIVRTTTDWIGWTFKVRVRAPTTGAIVAEVSAVGDASNNTIDEIGALLVTALNADDSIAGAAYASNTLKVAETTDNLGAHTVQVEARGPNGTVVPGVFGTVTHQGATDAALTVVMPADADVVPGVVVACDGA